MGHTIAMSYIAQEGFWDWMPTWLTDLTGYINPALPIAARLAKIPSADPELISLSNRLESTWPRGLDNYQTVTVESLLTSLLKSFSTVSEKFRKTIGRWNVAFNKSEIDRGSDILYQLTQIIHGWTSYIGHLKAAKQQGYTGVKLPYLREGAFRFVSLLIEADVLSKRLGEESGTKNVLFEILKWVATPGFFLREAAGKVYEGAKDALKLADYLLYGAVGVGAIWVYMNFFRPRR